MSWILIVILAIVLILGAVFCIIKYIHHYHYISFKESLELTGVPIVTFYQENKKLHFLIDTGADASYLNSTIIATIIHVPIEGSVSAISASGESINSTKAKSAITYEGKLFPWIFRVTDLTVITEGTGLVIKGSPVTIAGIIGSDFLTYYQYQLDFQKLLAYSKK